MQVGVVETGNSKLLDPRLLPIIAIAIAVVVESGPRKTALLRLSTSESSGFRLRL